MGELKRLLDVGDQAWATLLEALLEMPESDLAQLADAAWQLSWSAAKAADTEAAVRRRNRCKGYWSWADEQLRTGGAALFKLSRPQPEDTDMAAKVTTDAGMESWTLQTIDLLDQELDGWRQVWKRHQGVGTPWREERGQPVGDPLPPLTPTILREAAREFSPKKGYNGFNARWFLYLGDAALWGVCHFLEACERIGLWPEAVQHVMLHLIPKRGEENGPLVWSTACAGSGSWPGGRWSGSGGPTTSVNTTTAARAVVRRTRCGCRASTMRRLRR